MNDRRIPIEDWQRPPECSQVTCLKLFLVDRNPPSTEAVDTQNRFHVLGDVQASRFGGTPKSS